jgi:hypothetical protein
VLSNLKCGLHSGMPANVSRVFKLASVAVVMAMVGIAVCAGLGIIVWNSISAGSSRTAVPALTCPTAAPLQVGDITVPAGPVAGFCQVELANAAHIMTAARIEGLGTRTQTVGVMTAIGESGLRVLDHGDSAGPDSRGLFQQRDNGAWGTLTDRMDPLTSAENFFLKLQTVPDWQTMDPSLLAHTVQVNSDSNHYTRYWSAAQTIVASLAS